MLKHAQFRNIFIYKERICHMNIYSAAMPATSTVVFLQRQAVVCVERNLNNGTCSSA